mgnify:CR=1 FL=1
MVVKFFGNKKGGSSKAIDYLLNEREAQGTAKVLQGDPTITREIINSIQYKQKVTVGVLSFEEKNIDQEQKYKLMKEFEETLLPGMQDRYNILWVEHTDKDRLELNFVIPKIDLQTQKSLNPYYHKADLPRVEKWQDIQNLEYGYSSPKDPSKKRTLETHSIKHINNDYEQLDKLLHNLVAEGTIKNREHLTELLKENGYQVTRTGKDYISIKTPESKRAKKFKGSIYNERFTSLEELRTISEERSQTIREYSQRDTQRELTRLKSQLREYTQDKYEKLQQIYNRTPQRELTRDRAVQQERQKTNNISNSNIKSNDRDIRNDLHQTLSNTEREPRSTDSRSINGDKSGRIQSTSKSLQQLEEQSREPRERNRTATSNENSKQAINPRTERVASTTEPTERGQVREIYQSRAKEDIQRRGNTVQVGNDKGVQVNDSTRNTINGRTGTRETIEFRTYRKTRKARVELYKSFGEDYTRLRERAKQLCNEQQYNISQSERNKRQIREIEPTINRYARLKERASSYIKVAREYVKEKYNSYVNKYQELKHKLSSSQEFFTSTYKQVKEQGKELSFNDVKRASNAFEKSKTHNNLQILQEVKEREIMEKLERQNTRSRGFEMHR